MKHLLRRIWVRIRDSHLDSAYSFVVSNFLGRVEEGDPETLANIQIIFYRIGRRLGAFRNFFRGRRK